MIKHRNHRIIDGDLYGEVVEYDGADKTYTAVVQRLEEPLVTMNITGVTTLNVAVWWCQMLVRGIAEMITEIQNDK